MSPTILTLAIRSERDLVLARQRARQIARFLGFDSQDQVRIAAAVSEIARNALVYAGGGAVEYQIECRGAESFLVFRIIDHGPGIRDLERVLNGSANWEGLGLAGTRRLMDSFEIESPPGRGTTVLLKKCLPKRALAVTRPEIDKFVAELPEEGSNETLQELLHQNRELIAALNEIRGRQEDMARLNQELADTNRGVVALYAELDEKADRLRKADEVRSRFLSNMSHEFRSPLNSILALTGLLLNDTETQLGGEQKQQVIYLRKAAQDLLELVNDLLDLAKVGAGKIEVKPAEFSVSNLFAALRGVLRPILQNPSVDLVFEDVSGIQPVYTDEAKVSQILRNFITNALKFTEHGQVRVSASLAGSDIVFSVSDTGIGIAPENFGLIFEDFSQVYSPVQNRVKGTGLGLPLSKKLATLLGGDVEVNSQIGVGSTFSARIPIRYQEAVPMSIQVLIIDDNAADRYLVRQQLKQSSIVASEAVNGLDGLRMAAENTPDVIILDLQMPGLDGFQVLQHLGATSPLKDIPVVICTARMIAQHELARLNAAVAILNKEDLAKSTRLLLTTVQRAAQKRALSIAVG